VSAEVKHLGVLLHSSLNDNNDIQKPIYFFLATSKLKRHLCSTALNFSYATTQASKKPDSSFKTYTHKTII